MKYIPGVFLYFAPEFTTYYYDSLMHIAHNVNN